MSFSTFSVLKKKQQQQIDLHQVQQEPLPVRAAVRKDLGLLVSDCTGERLHPLLLSDVPDDTFATR